LIIIDLVLGLEGLVLVLGCLVLVLVGLVLGLEGQVLVNITVVTLFTQGRRRVEKVKGIMINEA